MAIEKIIQTRILNKVDTLENWSKSTLKIKHGEICLATVAASAGTGLEEPVIMAKIGTAEEKTFAELPWSFYAKASDVLACCKSEAGLTAFINNVIANAGIATDEAMGKLAERVTTLEGDENTAGSVAKAIKDAIDALNLADTYAAKEHEHVAADITDLDDTIKGYDYATKTEAQGYADAKDDAIAEAKKAGDDAAAALDTYKGEMTEALAGKQDVIPENTYDAYGAAAQALTDAKAYTDEQIAAIPATSWNDLTDKPFGSEMVEGVVTLEGDFTDRDYGDREYVEMGDTTTLVKMSDKFLTAEDLAGATLSLAHKNGEVDNIILQADMIMDGETVGAPGVNIVKGDNDTYVYSISAEGEAHPDMPLSRGTWFAVFFGTAYSYTHHVQSISCLTGEVETIKTLDEKYIPDTIARTDSVYTKTESDNKYALKGEDAYDDTALAGRVKAIEDDYLVEADIANFETKDNVALKADKSVVEAMYTNEQIDGFIAEAKKYADDNDADTKYGIVYDSDNKKIKLVEGGSEVEIDATDFIKDGMIETVTIGDDNDLIITFNTVAGKENIVLPLDQLVDIYTGVEGARVKVVVASDKSISAELVAGSISKNYLDDGVQASLAKADSALQAHQDISHLATTEALNGAKDELSAAIESAKTEAANQATVVLAEAQKHTDAEVAKDRERLATLEAIDHDAYKAADTTLKSELEGKINAINNHSHANKTLLDSITDEKVAAWDGAEQNAKDYADDILEQAKAYSDSLNHEDTKYTAAADGGLKLNENNEFSIDDTIVFILDCGTSV